MVKRKASTHGLLWIVTAVVVALVAMLLFLALTVNPAHAQSRKVVVSVSQTRPANTTAYTAGDVVCNSATTCTLLAFTDILDVPGGSGHILGIRYVCDQKSIVPRTRFHLYNASNPTVAADNVAMRESFADVSKRLGYVDLPALATPEDTTNSDMSYTQDFGLRHPVRAATGSRTLYVLRKTLDAYTPASASVCTTTMLVESDGQ